MCPDHKDNKKYRDNFDSIFRKKKKKPLKNKRNIIWKNK